MMKVRSGLALLLLIQLVVAACSPADGPATFTVDTLATGTVVVHNSDAGLWSDQQAWTVDMELQIGALDGEGER